MTSYLAKSMHGMEILTKTLQNRIIKETFAKKRMSKALFVQKKKGYGRTDRHLKKWLALANQRVTLKPQTINLGIGKQLGITGP